MTPLFNPFYFLFNVERAKFSLQPSGSFLRILIGRTFSSSSIMAISIGDLASGILSRVGAPIAICRALAPTILALSKRVIFGGPTQIFLSSLVMLELSSTFRSHATWGTLWRHWWALRFAGRNYVVDFKNHR